MTRQFLLVIALGAAACSSKPTVEVLPAPVEQAAAVTELPSTLTCGTTSPQLSEIYVGGYVSLRTECQGDGAKTIVVLDAPSRSAMGALSARYRVIAPQLRPGVRIDEQMQDLVMLIRKSSTGPVVLAGGGELATLLATHHHELVLAVVEVSKDRLPDV